MTMTADLRHFCWRVVAAALMVAVWTLALLVEAGVFLTLVAVLAFAPLVRADDDSRIRETVAPFVECNTKPVPLSAAGDFRINAGIRTSFDED